MCASDSFVAYIVLEKFLSVTERNELLRGTDIAVVPMLREGAMAKADIFALLEEQSSYCDERIEGVYLRVDGEKSLERRAKVVRSDFIQEDAHHWSKNKLVKNIVTY